MTASITRAMSDIYVNTCPHCHSVMPKIKPVKGTARPIESNFFGHKSNLDLADMRSCPDTVSRPGVTFTWIAVLRDHHTGFVQAVAPLTSKASADVAFALMPAFGCFGPPIVLIHDNGNEFAGEFSQDVALMWPGTKIICPRPRNPKVR